MSQRIRLIIKTGVFFTIGVVFFAVCNFIFLPAFGSYNYNSVYGIYKEPENTIETVFIGSSHVRNGISPIQLYEDFGICSYDIATDNQPVLVSYYWLEEVYRMHQDTLDTVVFDTSQLGNSYQTASCHKAIDLMEFSTIKLRAVKAYSNDFTDCLDNFFPIFAYHERWQELTDEDFLKFNCEPQLFFRGHVYSESMWIKNANDFSEIRLPTRVLDENADKTELNEISVEYFKKIVSFCEDHDICLVLIKTPTAWSSSDHNAVQELADEYGLDFLDFNIEPYYSEIDFNFATDLMYPENLDNLHLNNYGSMKLTNYVGSYLIRECGNKDVRDDEKYAFMDEEVAEYQQCVTFFQALINAIDPCTYIEAALEQEYCTIFISVKDDAGTSLTEDQRAYFESIGLTKLSQLAPGDSYLAVIDNGYVVTEKDQKDPGEGNETNDLITYTGTLHNGTAYTVVSGGYHMGNKSSIIIEGTERSNNKRGLNIAVYDNKLQQYLRTDTFDTHSAPERASLFSEQNYKTLIDEGTPFSSLTGTDRIMYLYNRECENDEIAKLARLEKDEDDGLITYLKAFWDDEDIDLFIATQGDTSEVLTDTVRADLSEMGFAELSQLSDQASYIAAISGGEIELEKCEYSVTPLEVNTDQYTIRSTGRDGSDDVSSVIMNGTEYFPEEDGIFIVIYDNITEMVVDTITFETQTDDTYDAEEIIG